MITRRFLCPLVAWATLSSGFAGELGKVQREVWRGIEGSGIWHLKNNPKFAGPADLTELVGGFNPPSNCGDDYGQRLRGYLHVPKSGPYKFFIAGDDNCELRLSKDDSKFNTRKVAWIVGLGWGHGRDWSAPREWKKIPTQESAGVQLEEGRRYFIEVVHKEGKGDDHVSVAWLKPGSTAPEVIPAASLESYSASSDPEDPDGNELADNWETEHKPLGRGTGQAMELGGLLADPDGDGLNNREEQLHSTDPLSPRGQEGFLQRDLWYGIWGREISDLTNSEAFYRRPDRRDLTKGASADTDYADECGLRLRGFLSPPVTGDYEFWIAGDDHCELWLSEGESKFAKRRIAAIDSEPGFVKPGQWENMNTQHSGRVALEVGKKYYVEILLKEGWWQDFVSVAWRRPGGEREQIPAAFLESYAPSAEDLDDDGLPGEWELAAGLDPRDGESAQGAMGDPDGDLIPNLMEWKEGTNPLAANRLPRYGTVEVWRNIPGGRVADLVDAEAFLKPATDVELVAGGLDFGDRGDSYGSRTRLYLKPPTSGSYRFWIAGDNHCELWLSDDNTKFFKRKIAWVKGPGNNSAGDWVDVHQWDLQASQSSAPIALEGGRDYFLEILHKESVGADHLSVSWQGPGTEGRQLVAEAHVASYASDEDDLDDDYLPDSWESRCGLDAQDNGRNDRLRQGEFGDYDRDRLTNREEFLLGTNPCSTDTDGDGVGDYDESRLYGSNPSLRDASPAVKYADLKLSRHQSALGSWSLTSSGTLYSTARRGEAAFNFDVSESGVYLVELSAVARSGSDYTPLVPVLASVDGTLLGKGDVSAEPTTLRWFTQWLSPGRHTVAIDNRNVRAGVALEITALSLYRHEGEDSDANGLPDWMEDFFFRENGVASPAWSSPVSPLCLEGRSRFAGSARVSYPGGETIAREGLRGGWYADIPLNPSAGIPVTVSYEGGALRSGHTLSWTTTNLFEAPAAMKLRKGDSLKVSAVPPGADQSGVAPTITLDSVALGSASADGSHVVTFSQPGSFVLRATTVSGTETLETATTVEVVEADFGATFSVALGSARAWKLPEVPKGLVIEADPELSLEETGSAEGGSRALIARYLGSASGSPRVIARLAEGGPIIAGTSVNAFRIVASSLSRDARQIDVLPDGTRVLEFKLLIEGRIPADLSIWLEFYVTDALFADGRTRYQLTAADFDENGVARVLVYKAPGNGIARICHWIRPYEGEGFSPSEGEESAGDQAAPGEEGD